MSYRNLPDFDEYDERRLKKIRQKIKKYPGYPHRPYCREDVELIKKKADSDMKQRIIRDIEETEEWEKERDKRDKEDIKERLRSQERWSRLEQEAWKELYG